MSKQRSSYLVFRKGCHGVPTEISSRSLARKIARSSASGVYIRVRVTPNKLRMWQWRTVHGPRSARRKVSRVEVFSPPSRN